MKPFFQTNDGLNEGKSWSYEYQHVPGIFEQRLYPFHPPTNGLQNSVCYAELGITDIMPSSELCRVIGLYYCFSVIKKLITRHNSDQISSLNGCFKFINQKGGNKYVS